MSAMILSGGMACLFLPHNETAYAGERFNQSTALTTEQLTASSIDDAASRSSQRGDLTADGTWDMGDQPDRKLTIIHADNPVVGSHLGDGGMWADSAKALGYWVDDTPRQGDVIVFSPAQVSNAWGHVAIVEKVNGDDSIEISEANVNGQVGPFRRTIEAKQTHEYQYIHY